MYKNNYTNNRSNKLQFIIQHLIELLKNLQFKILLIMLLQMNKNQFSKNSKPNLFKKIQKMFRITQTNFLKKCKIKKIKKSWILLRNLKMTFDKEMNRINELSIHNNCIRIKRIIFN